MWRQSPREKAHTPTPDPSPQEGGEGATLMWKGEAWPA